MPKKAENWHLIKLAITDQIDEVIDRITRAIYASGSSGDGRKQIHDGCPYSVADGLCDVASALDRIADALERLQPAPVGLLHAKELKRYESK